jgi:hypothetical protein
MDKKTIVLIGSVLVAVIFISSLAGFGNQSGTTTTTSTIISNTTFVAGNSNATVYGYSPTVVITMPQGAENASSSIGNVLGQMLSNGTISDFFPEGTGYVVYLGNTSAYNLSTMVMRASGNVTGITFNATLRTELPTDVILYNSGVGYNVHVGNSTYAVQTDYIANVGDKLPVNIQAIVYKNASAGIDAYSVYNGNIKISIARVLK